MDLKLLRRRNEFEWEISPHGKMRVPAVIYASEDLIRAMDEKVYEQICNVATLPGVVKEVYAMPDAHWGYGFPIGGVAAFDPDEGGVVSAGGVGFDISCGVRLLRTGLRASELHKVREDLAEALFRNIPAGVGSKSHIRLSGEELDNVLLGGARWAVSRGYGFPEDLNFIEENGQVKGARPEEVSPRAKERQRPEMGTLGSGNHYLEVQEVAELFDEEAARTLGLKKNEVVISIHCGSRGLGHQIGTDFLKEMALAASRAGLELPDKELACAPINSPVGQSYLGAMRAAINCALANRQMITHFTRQVFKEFFPGTKLELVYDVSHNTCKEEWHNVEGRRRKLFVHRKGATRAFGPGHCELPYELQKIGQPVFIGGSMGTGSYVLVGMKTSEERSFNSACHGAGRAMSRTQAIRKFQGNKIVHDLKARGILIRSPSFRGVAEEAPDAYKNVDTVVDSAERAGLAKKVAKLTPLICIKG